MPKASRHPGRIVKGLNFRLAFRQSITWFKWCSNLKAAAEFLYGESSPETFKSSCRMLQVSFDRIKTLISVEGWKFHRETIRPALCTRSLCTTLYSLVYKRYTAEQEVTSCKLLKNLVFQVLLSMGDCNLGCRMELHQPRLIRTKMLARLVFSILNFKIWRWPF